MFYNNRQKKIRKQVIDFYDTVSHRFSQTRKNWWKDLDFIGKYLKPGDKLLDFGCGNGRLLEMIYEKDLKVDYTGVDVSRSMVDIAESRYAEEKFLAIDSEKKLPFNEESFDSIVSIAVFHHLTPQMAGDAAEEFDRILKKEGVVIITAWYLWDKKRIQYLFGKIWRRILGVSFARTGKIPFSYSTKESGETTYWRFCYWWTKKNLKRVFQKKGFQVLESGYSFDKRNNKRNIYVVAKKKA